MTAPEAVYPVSYNHYLQWFAGFPHFLEIFSHLISIWEVGIFGIISDCDQIEIDSIKRKTQQKRRPTNVTELKTQMLLQDVSKIS